MLSAADYERLLEAAEDLRDIESASEAGIKAGIASAMRKKALIQGRLLRRMRDAVPRQRQARNIALRDGVPVIDTSAGM